jgi:predicted DNA-binding transcriptional regulator AlpA
MSEILTTRQASDYLKLAVSTVEKLRCHGGGPKFIKLGSRRVAYLKPDLEEWISSRPRCASTSDPGNGRALACVPVRQPDAA